MTRRELIWCTAYGTAFAASIRRLLDLGESRDADGTMRPFLNDESERRAHEQAERIANLAADLAEGRGPG